MIKEVFISLYLFVFKQFFNLFSKFPLKNRVCFVVSFPLNTLYLKKALNKFSVDMVFIYKDLEMINEEIQDSPIIDLNSHSIVQFLRTIYYLATSKVIVVDNYYGFLASTDFRQGVECIQIWHAAGAIKQFGLQDISNSERSLKAINRFKKVYSKFDKVVVGSDRMTAIFKSAFAINQSQILETGIPRTDFFFESNENKTDELRNKLNINNKKILLYAPTYRDGQLEEQQLALNIDKLYKFLKDDWQVIIKLHPAVSKSIKNNFGKYGEFITDLSHYPNINELLLIADILVTDYSSLPMEFSLLNKPMVFFAYDYHNYKKIRGLYDDYIKNMPGPIAWNTDDVINFIKNGEFSIQKVKKYSIEWNAFSKGHSSENLAAYIVKFLSQNEMGKSDERLNRREQVVK